MTALDARAPPLHDRSAALYSSAAAARGPAGLG